MKKLSIILVLTLFLSLVYWGNVCLGQTITRTQIISNATPYTSFTWTAYADNILANGNYCSGVGRTVYHAPYVTVGSNTGMPYCWGGWSTQAQHTGQMTSSSNTQAGDVCSVSGGGCTGFSSAPLSCASGHDCSGFVSRAWGLGSKYSTTTLPNISTAISLTATQPGDIVNLSGDHTRLIETNYGNGNYQVMEASANGWITTHHTYTASNLSSYDPRKYNNVIESTNSVSCGNDDCNGAVTLTSNGSCHVCSVDNATADGFTTPSCDHFSGTILGAGVFFNFTAVSTAHTVTVTPTTTGSTALDAVVVAYNGNCFNLQEVGCADANNVGVAETLALTGLTIGQVYTIRVYDYGAGAPPIGQGGFTICLTHVACTPPPTPTGITGGGVSACQSSTAQIDLGALGQNPANLSGGGQWVWYTGSCGGTQVGTGPDLFVSETQAINNQTYYLRAESNGCGNSSCVSTTVTVIAKPTTAVPTVTPTQPCLGGNFTFSSNASGSNYEWYNPSNSLFSTQQNPVVTNGSAGQYCVSYKVNGCWSDNGCTNVTFASAPTLSFSPTQPEGCGSVSVTAISSGSTFQWSNGGNNPNSITSSGSYGVTATNSNGCTASGSVSVTIDIPPSAGATANPSSINVGENSLLTATGGVNYTWSDGLGTGNPVSVQPQSTKTYYVTVIDIHGCSATAGVTVSVVPVGCAYTVAPLVITTDSNGTSQQITVTVDSGNNCSWSAVITGNCPWLTVQNGSAVGSGSFTVSIPATNDTTTKTCQITVAGKTIQVTQTGKMPHGTGGPCGNPLANPQLQISGCDLSITAVANVIYQWYFGSVPIATANSNIWHAQSGNGVYYVVITSLLNSNCTAQSTPITANCPTGIEELAIKNLSIYPNPSSGTFMINFETDKVKEIQIGVYDLVGQLIKEEPSLKVTGPFSKEINIQGVAKGVYMLQIKAGDATINRKIEIE